MLCTECKQSQTTRQRTGGERKWASGTTLGKQLLWGAGYSRCGTTTLGERQCNYTKPFKPPEVWMPDSRRGLGTTPQCQPLPSRAWPVWSLLYHSVKASPQAKKSLTGGGTTKHGAWQPQLPATRCLLSSANGVATTALSKTTARGVASTAPGVVSTSYGSGTSEAKLGQAF